MSSTTSNVQQQQATQLRQSLNSNSSYASYRHSSANNLMRPHLASASSNNLSNSCSPRQQQHNYHHHPHHSHSHHQHASHGTAGASLHHHTSADSQLLPSHLKCGMCASLVLASVFVAAAKFYFDHQGTGLEVLIFCAFSATLLLAACTVSLCPFPKVMMHAMRTNAAMQAANMSNHHHSNTHTANASIVHLCDETNAVSAMYGATQHQQQQQQHLQMDHLMQPLPQCSPSSTSSTTQSGPPPYHIAILLPEQGNKPSTVRTLDESPPPSYDKILI